jgi:hypothetical protein
MKWAFRIPQQAIVECGLCGKLSFMHFALLWYLRAWADYENVDHLFENGQRFVWIEYKNAIEENPMIFSCSATERTNKNRMSKLVAELRAARLLETYKRGHRLYFFLTEKAGRLYAPSNAKKSVTEKREEVVTQMREKPVTEKRETKPASILYETNTTETKNKETTPLVPKGDECFSDFLSEEELKETLFRCLGNDPHRPLTANEERAFAKSKIEVTRADANFLELFYSLPDDRDDPSLSTRKRKFSTLVGDLPAQIEAARRRCPLPRPKPPEPPDEIVHAWLREKYPNCVLMPFSRLPGDVREEFLEQSRMAASLAVIATGDSHRRGSQ